MLTFLAIIHVIVAIGLVVFVLLQDPKGGAAGVFGGGSSSNTFFGSSGASNFLSTTTKWLAVVFACTSLILTAYTSKKPTSVLDRSDIPTPTSSPVGVGSSAPAGNPVAPTTAAPATPPAAPAPEQK
jgi:preprotein translocase subunit SecG